MFVHLVEKKHLVNSCQRQVFNSMEQAGMPPTLKAVVHHLQPINRKSPRQLLHVVRAVPATNAIHLIS